MQWRVLVLAAMAKLWLSLMLVGPTAAFLLTVPKPTVSVPSGNTAWLSALLNFTTSLPHYFQIRWYFVTGPQLVLMLMADNCKASKVNQHWRDSCKIRIEKTEGYRHRAELSSLDASLALQDVRAEDSGIYSVTLLALGVKLSANINLTVIDGGSTSNYQTESSSKRAVPVLTIPPTGEGQDEEKNNNRDGDDEEDASLLSTVDMEVPVSSAKAANDRDYTVLNIIQLSLAGLILCLLGLIIAENISFTYSMKKKTSARDGRETILHPPRMDSTLLSLPDNPSMFVKMPGSDEFRCIVGC